MKITSLLIASLGVFLVPISAHTMDNYEILELTLDSKVTYTAKKFSYTIESDKCTTNPQPPQKIFPQKALQYVKKEQKARGQEKVLYKAIPGKDGRTRIVNTSEWPYSSFTKLDLVFSDGWGIFPTTAQYTGSGTIIGPHHILTCAHNVYNQEDKKYVSSISVVPALNDNYAPFGEIKVTRFYLFKKYVQHEQNKNLTIDLDIALLILDKSIGMYTGWAGISTDSDENLKYNYVKDGFFENAYKVNITGYPGDKGHNQMWTMSHKLQDLNKERFEYLIDTNPGQSGSPIWVSKNGGPVILGVHTHGGGLQQQNDGANSGVRLSKIKVTDLIIPYIMNTYELNSQ